MRLLLTLGLATTACTVDSRPPAATPVPECRTDQECDDGLPCTDDRCTDALGCTNTPLAGTCAMGDSCLDCTVLDAPERCERGVCDPAEGCVVSLADAGTSCAESTCGPDGVTGPGACDATGACIAAQEPPCQSDGACDEAFCDAAGRVCLTGRALTPDCALDGTFRGIELRAASLGTWEFHGRTMWFDQGQPVLSTLIDEDGQTYGEADWSYLHRAPGQYEIAVPPRKYQATLTPDGGILAGQPTTSSGLLLLVKAPDAPPAPDAIAGRWAIQLMWDEPGWYTVGLPRLNLLLGELALVKVGADVCTQQGDRLSNDTLAFEVHASDCTAVEGDGTFTLAADFRYGDTASEIAQLTFHGVVSADAQLVVARVQARNPETDVLEPVNGLATWVRLGVDEGLRHGSYATTSLVSVGQYRGAVTFDAGRLVAGKLDRLSDFGGCLDGGAGKFAYTYVDPSGPADGQLVDLALVRDDAEGLAPGNARQRIWLVGRGLPGDAALGGATPLWIGARVLEINLTGAPPRPASWGPALLVWQRPDALSLGAPFEQDPSTWCFR